MVASTSSLQVIIVYLVVLATTAMYDWFFAPTSVLTRSDAIVAVVGTFVILMLQVLIGSIDLLRHEVTARRNTP